MPPGITCLTGSDALATAPAAPTGSTVDTQRRTRTSKQSPILLLFFMDILPFLIELVCLVHTPANVRRMRLVFAFFNVRRHAHFHVLQLFLFPPIFVGYRTLPNIDIAFVVCYTF
jgi:hypothetical protein